MARKTEIQVRRGTAAQWTSANPVLGAGEMGWESDTDKLKFGDGSTAWASLGYFAGSGSGITKIASPGSTITVTNPTGPTADLDLPTSGVTAGSYGSSTQVARVTVNAEGIVTAASQVGIGGLPGSGLVLLFSQTLVSAGTLDTGVNGIAAGHGDLFVVCLVGSNTASTQSMFCTVNGDTASSYGQRVLNDGTLSTTSGSGGWTFGAVIPANSSASLGALTFWVPRYSDTGVQKVQVENYAATAVRISQGGGVWPSTAAINRLNLGANTAASPANFITGSSLFVYGTQ